MLNDAAIIECGSLRIEFVWSGDRYGHRILGSSSKPECLLTSIEGRSNEKWPSSSPLQSLHIESRPGGGRIAMLVGMAGRSHWSMSVEADVAGNRFLFDVACRIAEVPSWLGSSYDAAIGADAAFLPIQIEPLASAILQLEDGRRAIIVAPFSEGTFPRTVRWRYGIGLRRNSPDR
jgi:hypothetical protein